MDRVKPVPTTVNARCLVRSMDDQRRRFEAQVPPHLDAASAPRQQARQLPLQRFLCNSRSSAVQALGTGGCAPG